MKNIFVIFFGLLLIFFPMSAEGDMVSGDNVYRIYADSVDGGGGLSVGGPGNIYNLEDSIGESMATTTAGGIYEVRGGYQAMTSSSISISLSDGSISLGDLSSGAVKSDSTIVYVTTDDVTGYTLSIGSATWAGNTLSDVGGDHVVDIGSEEYGVAVSGGDSSLVGDWPVLAGTALAASSTPVYNSPATLTFKASISGVTVIGAYSQSVVLQASVNLGL